MASIATERNAPKVAPKLVCDSSSIVLASTTLPRIWVRQVGVSLSCVCVCVCVCQCFFLGGDGYGRTENRSWRGRLTYRDEPVRARLGPL